MPLAFWFGLKSLLRLLLAPHLELSGKLLNLPRGTLPTQLPVQNGVLGQQESTQAAPVHLPGKGASAQKNRTQSFVILGCCSSRDLL
jgi:hypothetical protein